MVIVLEFIFGGYIVLIVVFKIDKFGNSIFVLRIDIYGKFVIDLKGNIEMVIVLVLN